MRLADSWTSVTVSRIEALVSTVEWVADWIAAILAAISSVARAVWLARLFTSWATTAKPRPASPARAARSEEHTSELQSTNAHPVCRVLLEKKQTRHCDQ